MARKQIISKRNILLSLHRDILVHFVNEWNLKAADLRIKEKLVDSILSEPEIDFEDLLKLLYRKTLKKTCREFGLDDSGKSNKVIIKRILNEIYHDGKRKPNNPSFSYPQESSIINYGRSRQSRMNTMRNMSLFDFIDNATKVLSSNSHIKSRFESDIEMLEERRNIWSKTDLRVGVIGITSSGKSTLLNAFLGGNFLPQAVLPSTNGLVVCAHAKKASATIHYKDGKTEEVYDRKEIENTLEKIGNEQNNPNCHKLKEIELYSPNFLFQRGFTLVDTPGLNAYKLEEHENITLKLFMPSIDIALFVTTCKSNADERVRYYLDLIADEGKEIVLAQNMVDSVEPKKGVGGIIVKTKTEVATEWMKRMRCVLQSSHHEKVRYAPICQVSAKFSLCDKNYRRKLDSLVSTVKEQFDTTKIEFDRRRRIVDILKKIIKREEVSTNPEEAERQLFCEIEQLEKTKSKNNEYLDEIKNDCRKLIENAEKKTKSFSDRASGLYSTSVKSAESLNKKVNDWIEKVPKDLDNIIKSSRKKQGCLAEQLGISLDDLRRFSLSRHKKRQVTIRTSWIPSRWTNKEGVIAGIGRFFGKIIGEDNWGKKKIPGKRVIDVDSIRFRVAAECQKEKEWLQYSVQELIAQAEKSAKTINGQIDLRLSAINQKREKTLDEKARHAVIEQLKELIECVNVKQGLLEGKIPEDRTIGEMEECRNIAVPSFIRHLISLGQIIVDQSFLTLRDECMNSAHKNKKGAGYNALVWGWDMDSLQRFVDRFWWDYLKGPITAPHGMEKIDLRNSKYRQIAIFDENTWIHNKKRTPNILLKRPCTVFCLADMMQYGSTMKLLYDSKLFEALRANNYPLVLVVQEIQSLISDDKLYDLWTLIKRFKKESELDPVRILVNHNSPVYSILYDMAYRKELRVLADEKVFFKKIDAIKPGEKEYALIASALRKIRCKIGGLLDGNG